MKLILKNKIWWTAGAMALGVLVIVFLTLHMATQAPSAPVAVTAPSSTSQQAVDTGLSLAPSSTAASAPNTPKVTPPPATAASGCDLDLSFSIVSGNVNTAGTMQYALAAKNLGNAACQSASISVYYADSESFVSSMPAATADGYYWVLGTLAPGKEDDISLTTDRSSAASASAAVMTNEACLSADNGSDACANAGSASPASANTAASAQATPAAPVAGPSTYSPAKGQEYGVWVWTTLTDMTDAQMQQTVDEASANNFNVIYLTVDDYLTIAAVPDVATRQAELQDYDQRIGTFLSLAAAKGIRVDAESGSRDWAEPTNIANAYREMIFVASYNQTHAVKFGGVQYDIEPYLLPEYNTDESDVLTQYVQLIDGLVQADKTESLPLTIVVPDFYGSSLGWTPTVTVDGVTDYTYEQILRLLNELPAGDGRVIVMAYRNFAQGSDGTIDLSNEEVTKADAGNVKVLVAQETGPVTPSYVTFYGMTRSELFGQVGEINQAFASDNSFAGIAIDYLDPFLNLQ